MSTPKIAAFLAARLDDEARRLDVPEWRCTDSARGPGWGSRGIECDLCGQYMHDGTEVATEEAWHEHLATAHGREQRELAAKRAILDLFEARRHAGISDRWHAGQVEALDFALRHLASVYADHPDYRPEWRRP
jgi:hypothetical protein